MEIREEFTRAITPVLFLEELTEQILILTFMTLRNFAVITTNALAFAIILSARENSPLFYTETCGIVRAISAMILRGTVALSTTSVARLVAILSKETLETARAMSSGFRTSTWTAIIAAWILTIRTPEARDTSVAFTILVT